MQSRSHTGPDPMLTAEIRVLSLAAANRIAGAAMALGEAKGSDPLCVAVLDAGGHLLAVQRHERAGTYRLDIALAKGRGCIGMGVGGRALAARAQGMPALYAAFNQITAGLVPVPGGVLIRDAGGDIIGAVGVSGDSADNDEAAALAGIAAVGLIADTGA